MIIAPNPHQGLREYLAPSLHFGAIVECYDKIKLSILLPSQKVLREVARHLQNDVWVGLGKFAEKLGQERRCVFVWSAKAYSSRDRWLPKVGESLIIESQYSLGILCHEHPFGCQNQFMGIPMEQLNFGQLF